VCLGSRLSPLVPAPSSAAPPPAAPRQAAGAAGARGPPLGARVLEELPGAGSGRQGGHTQAVEKAVCFAYTTRIGLFFVPPAAAAHTLAKVAFLAHSAFTLSPGDPGPPAHVFVNCTWDYRR
jgi:hypothetical protein